MPSTTQTQIDVGHTKDGQGDKQHVVIRVASGWALLCTRKPATLKSGTHPLDKEAVTCKTCFDEATSLVAT